MLLLEKELGNAGFSVKNFWEAARELKHSGEFQPEKGENSVMDAATWFFFSQLSFLVAEKKKEFGGKMINVEKDGIRSEMSPLAFFLIKYIDGDVSENGMYILFTEENNRVEKSLRGQGWMEEELKKHFGDMTFLSAMKEMMVFSDKINEKKKQKSIREIPTTEEAKVSELLASAGIAVNDYVQACKEVDSQSVFHDLERPGKMLPYWENVLLAISDPLKEESDIEKQLRSPMITQGNLSRLAFVLTHYILLWKKMTESSTDVAKGIFKAEAEALKIMKNVKVEEGESDQLSYLLNVLKEIVSDEIYIPTMTVVVQAVNYISTEKKESA